MNHPVAPMLDALQSFASWRVSCADGLNQWLAWLLKEDLCAASDEAQLREVITKLKDERFTVAIVAELSRGKSELINALLFTEHGRRIVPSGAGRTTMCPTEFYCDVAIAPCIDLLPIETRSQPEGIAELKRKPQVWERFVITSNDPEELATNLLKVGETQNVPKVEAQRLGLADEDHQTEFVTIPRWRHARVNLHHPLLATGLSVLDTPGLNALGNEPELTYAVLPSVDAVLFLLSADAGVTRSDLNAWNQYLSHIPESAKWVVLNKIDSLWDELKSDLEIRTEIAKQAEQCAKVLNVPVSQVFPLSAKKGLLARVNSDPALLLKSRIEPLEKNLIQGLMHSRKSMLADRARHVASEVFQEAQAQLQFRIEQAHAQLRELQSLASSTTNEATLQTRFKTEREHFIKEGKAILSLRKEVHTHTQKIFDLLMQEGLDYSFSELLQACETGSPQKIETCLMQSLITVQNKLIAARAESDSAVTRLRVARNSGELKSPRPKRLALDEAIQEIERLKANINLDMPFIPILTGFHRSRIKRTVNAMVDRIKVLFEDSVKDAELWLFGLVTPLERTLREHQDLVRKRTDTLDKVSEAQTSMHELLDTMEVVISQEKARQEQLMHRSKEIQVFFNVETSQADLDSKVVIANITI